MSRGKFRLRSLGNRHVLSPEFDCLSGGVLLLPEELEWAEDDKSMADITFEDLPPVKLCPFCRKAPEFKSFSSSYWGHRVGPEPYMLNKFQLQCCEWVSKMTFESPFYAIEEWNKKLSS
ncbi:hypothetical protein MXF26_12450 [Pantoea dispersa]|uniref:hypothetical protein n=1 Tax=Pantoea dispersa TaxID=59814 RepID=UPI002DBFDFE3|nr:hypothetical protein [Pantoea dispersa]MEB5837062.1 hypothetical protein [Pantoea dispersa]